MTNLITGIQQIGIGVQDAHDAKMIYRDLFRMDALIFDDKSPATLMTGYTGDVLHHRHAILSMNLSGGGGFEIWQFTSRNPTQNINLLFGDLGIFGAKIKCQDLNLAHKFYKQISTVSISQIFDNYFWVKDKYGNHFQLVQSDDFFHSNNHICGGVTGAIICVSEMDTAISFYQNFLGLNEIVSDREITGDSFISQQEENRFRSVIIRKSKSKEGAFSKLLGGIQLELIQPLNRTPSKIFKDRYWGDCGFIHLCFDVLNMDILKNKAESMGYKFTVDSKDSYAMDTSAGRFCYVEDPDGTLIELVETHKIPVFKKLGWHIDLKKRKNDSPLPDWMIKMLGLNKVK